MRGGLITPREPTMSMFFKRYRVLIQIYNKLLDQERLLYKIMATIEERFTAVNAKLDEASTEILALLEQLRALGVTPAAEAILTQIEGKANALADIVPNP